MTPDDLASRLGLEPHPEGGYFRERYRSDVLVRPADGRGPRAACTTILFLLPAGQHSRWHVVGSDELWTFRDGTPLELLTCDPVTMTSTTTRLGPANAALDPSHLVPAGHWQAARPLGDFALVECTVAPGFDYADFRLLSDDAAAADRLRTTFPAFAGLL